MKEITVQEFGSQAAELIDAVAQGEYVTIFNDGKPIAQLVPVTPPDVVRRPGSLKGKIYISPEFDDPLPDDIRVALGGKP